MFEHCQLIDLTHPLNPKIPTWTNSCGFQHKTVLDYEQCTPPVLFRIQELTMHGGAGTHIDAPSHCIPGALNISDLPLERLLVPAYVIDVSSEAHPDYLLPVEAIQAFEKKNGLIKKNSLVIVWTGWGRHWNDPQRYRNEDEKGAMHFPAISAEAAQYLLNKEVAGVGIDTLSPDCSDKTFPVHRILLGAGIYIIENFANCDKLPPSGATVIALPLNIQHGSESAIRAIGIIQKKGR